jgi:hypothetical protein
MLGICFFTWAENTLESLSGKGKRGLNEWQEFAFGLKAIKKAAETLNSTDVVELNRITIFSLAPAPSRSPYETPPLMAQSGIHFWH